jgi:hypothetical protein
MLTFLGTILMIIAIGAIIAKKFFNNKMVEEVIGNVPYKAFGGLVAFGLILTMIMFAREGHVYYALNLLGQRYVISTPGPKINFPYTKIQEWEKYIDIKGIKYDKNDQPLEPTEGIEGVIKDGVRVRFIDKVNAKVYPSVRFEMPADDQAFIKLVETYRNPKNLVNNTLIPTITEQLGNVTFMYSAEDYVSGSATDYKMTVEDPLKNGGFVVKKVEVRDTIYAESMTVDSNLVNKQRAIREIRNLTKNEKVFVNGVPKRSPHEINVNQVITAQVIISNVELEEKFEDKLTQQRDISAEKIIEIQKIETARAAQQRIVAEGERDKAAERVTQEKDQVKKLIAIETQVKEEESKRQLAETALKTEELKAKAIKVGADAESYKNRQLVSAGLTPQERAQIEKDTKIGVAAEIAKLNLPNTVVMGGSGTGKGNTGLLEQLLGAKLAENMGLVDSKK